MSPRPLDPATTPYALEGRIVTMNGTFAVLPRGRIYVDGGRIVDVLPADAPRPPGMEAATVVRVGGTIYPGLIELHNHLSY
ncbi:MAG: amidohydrolase family protein, partial [Vicinamibacterales bacterium]